MTEPKDLPPHLEFLLQSQGTLPEFITEADLETLNSGLRFLFAHLRDARQQFENEGDGGRLAAVTALGGLWQFIVLFKEPLANSLQIPVLHEQAALAALEENLVFQIHKPVPRRGRPPSGHVHAAMIGHAAGTVQRLLQIGLTRDESHRAVAAHLTKLGVKTGRGGRVTANTVRHWCDEVAIDGHGLAAQLCHSILSEIEDSDFATSSRGEARIRVLDKLSAWVWGIIPASPKPS